MGDEKWHSMPQQALFKRLQTSESGISEKRAKDALEEYGPNALLEVKKDPWY